MNDNEKVKSINQIISNRSELLKNTNFSLIPVGDLANYGRVMMFYVDDTVCDGYTEVISMCYVDGNDAPPFDTLLCVGKQLNSISFYNGKNNLREDAVLAWIPKSQYYFANQALEGACFDNFEWATDENINPDFSMLNQVFQKPNEIADPEKPIDYPTRKLLIAEINNKLNKNSR